jgi:hypothetical protein
MEDGGRVGLDTINAHPTKAFFIEMLTRDVDLTSCIVDLTDNSIDGARRLGREEDLTGLTVSVRLSADCFEITDNCGGIEPDLARDYAFRFGRHPSSPALPGSIGQFGVGMKRALFRIGRAFKIVSKTTTSAFEVDVDVNDWADDPDNWTFRFTSLTTDTSRSEDQTGTTILVTKLIPLVSSQLGSEAYQRELEKRLQLAHYRSLQLGLTVLVNGARVPTKTFALVNSDKIQPARVRREYAFPQGPPIIVDLFAGIANSEPDEAGWYIFCNDRLVLAADKTLLTGWGTAPSIRLVRYHNQYARFRGFAILTCAAPERLPWNTTKNGLDTSSEAYVALRRDISQMMIPVITFLSELDAESDFASSEGKPLQTAVTSAADHLFELSRIDERPRFQYPARQDRVRPPLSRIHYSVSAEDLERAKRQLGARNNKEVGEQTFQYYLEMEVD